MLVAKKEQRFYYNDANTKKQDIRRTIQNKKNIRKAKKRVALKFKILSYAIIMLVICLSLLLRYTYIAQYRIQISSLDKEISSLAKKKENLEIELDKIKDSEWIELEAREKLGMDYPTSSQTVYLSVDESIFDEDPVEKQDNKLFRLKFFSGFIDKIFGLL